MKTINHYFMLDSARPLKRNILAGDRAGHFLLWLVCCSIAAPMVVVIIYKAFG